ncbi:MAG: hypothetical protein ACK40V_05270, partial [Anaerolineales bacterium]
CLTCRFRWLTKRPFPFARQPPNETVEKPSASKIFEKISHLGLKNRPNTALDAQNRADFAVFLPLC